MVIEPTSTGYAGHVPDLEGCVARARTVEELERQMRTVVEFHLAGLRRSGGEAPVPRAWASTLELVAADDAGRLSCSPCETGSGRESPS